MKRNILFILSLLVCAYSFGQGEIDAYRLSSNDLQGTARAQGMGGAFGALGGDISGVAINPAGIGVYRSSEVVATMAYTNVNTETNKNSVDNHNKGKFNFENLSYMGYFPLGKDVLKSINFGFSYNRLKNFDQKYTGFNAGRATSLTDYICERTYGTDYPKLNTETAYNFRGVPWLSILGWQGGLIKHSGYDDQGNAYYRSILEEGEKVDSEINVVEKGYIETYDFTFGTNLSDRLYLGLTFSITDMYYEMYSIYWEDFARGQNRGFSLDNYLDTEGSGYQLKVGAIFRPTDQIRIGVAYHSPTWYSLTDHFQATLAPYSGIPEYEGAMDTPNNAYSNYKIQTPYAWTFSFAAILGSRASISLDYEIKDYSSMKLQDNHGYDYEDNQFVSEDFRATSTLRAGLEYKFTPQFSGRLGYAWMQNPYTTDFRDGKIEVATAGTVPHYTLVGDAHYLTAGLGYRFTPQFYMDVAFVYRTQSDDLYYYSPMPDFLASQKATLKNNTYRGLLTLGYKF